MPNYSIREAASYLGIARSTARAWVKGQGRFKAVVTPADPKTPALSFFNLVELHVLSSLRKEGPRLPVIRDAIKHVERKMGIDRPLANVAFQTDGVGIFVEVLGQIIDVSRDGQVAMRKLITSYLRRVDYGKDGLALRLYPFTRLGELEDPKAVVFDPKVSFGRLVVTGTGIPTAEIADRFNAGETLTELADDFSVELRMVEEALRCELHRKTAA
jgi:uncharacterized protein (DUF433 family)